MWVWFGDCVVIKLCVGVVWVVTVHLYTTDSYNGVCSCTVLTRKYPPPPICNRTPREGLIIEYRYVNIIEIVNTSAVHFPVQAGGGLVFKGGVFSSEYVYIQLQVYTTNFNTNKQIRTNKQTNKQTICSCSTTCNIVVYSE